LAGALGAIVSLLAIGFVEAVLWLNEALLISPRSRVQLDDPRLLAVLTLLVPSLGGLAVGLLLYRWSPARRGLGPPDVIRATQLGTALPDERAGAVSTLAAIVSLGCGASVGQYGPLVYLGAMVGAAARRLRVGIPNLASIATACGVAAAISTAFNAPIAGLVFAHEVILRHYSLQAFAPTTVASAAGFVVANVVFDRPALFLVDFDGVEHGHEFVLFAILGILCALLAVAFIRAVLLSARLAAGSGVPRVLRPALAGLIVGVVALQLPDVLGIGREVLRFATIPGAFGDIELAVLVLAKTLLTALCIGFGFAGGVFSPSLLIGILFGALFWSLLALGGIPNSGVAVYAIGGMMALASPVIGAPLTTILIVYELTRSYELTVAAMVSVVFSNLLAYRLVGRSLFDIQLKNQGVDLSEGRDRALLQNTLVVDLCTGTPHTLQRDCTRDDAIAALIGTNAAEAVVVDDGGRYRGVVRLQDLLRGDADGEATLERVLNEDWLGLDETSTLWEAMTRMRDFVGERVPVVDRASGELIGVVTEGDIIAAYLAVVHRVREEENESL